MAISFIGSTGASALNGNAATLTVPASRIAGDVSIVSVTVGTTKSFTLTVTTSSGASYSQVLATFTSSNARFGVFRRILASSLETQVTVGGTAGSSDSVASVIMIFRGVDNTNPEDVTITSTTGSGANADSPNITVASNNDVIISSVGIQLNTVPSGAPAGFSNLTTRAGNDTWSSATAMSWIANASTAALNPGAYTSAAGSWCAATIALRPDVSEFVGWQRSNPEFPVGLSVVERIGY